MWRSLTAVEFGFNSSLTPKELNKMLIREKRDFLFQECLKFLNTRVDLDLADYKNDIFSH